MSWCAAQRLSSALTYIKFKCPVSAQIGNGGCKLAALHECPRDGVQAAVIGRVERSLRQMAKVPLCCMMGKTR